MQKCNKILMLGMSKLTVKLLLRSKWSAKSAQQYRIYFMLNYTQCS